MTADAIRSIKKTWAGIIPVAVLSFLVSGCGPSQQEMMAKDRLEKAKAVYEQARANPDAQTYAPAPLYDAQKALRAAERAKDPQEMEHLSYLAERKAQTVMAVTQQRKAERETGTLTREISDLVLEKRDQEARLARAEAEKAKLLALDRAAEAEKARMDAEARARETEQARMNAEARARETEQARMNAEAKAREAEKARRETEAKSRELEEARKLAEARAREAEAAKKTALAEAEKAALARAETEQLAKEISDLKAKATDRGIVLTLGDVLFATGKSSLFPGAVRTVHRLGDFLKKYPERKVLIEGHTDSVGTEEFNLGLSQKRAEAVREELLKEGIGSERIFTRGYGKKYPEANNETPAGRQQNRRVEVIILKEGADPEAQFRD